MTKYGYCKCGCGKITNICRGKHRKFIIGHHTKNVHPWNYGMKMSEEFCKKTSKGHKGIQAGENNPNFGGKYSLRGEDNSRWEGGLSAQLARRRNLGYETLNKRFPNSHGHHVDENVVIFIPKEMHEKYWHSLNIPKTMKKINKLAFEFYSIQWFKEHNIEID